MISGCSGGGKSTLLAEFGDRGYATVPEPGRRIVREELERGGTALPWSDLAGFARRAIETALDDHDAAAAMPGLVFFDRGLVDAFAALEHATGEPAIAQFGPARRYARRVFMAPPWPEIYASDPERPHGYAAAEAEHARLAAAYAALGYEAVALPKASVAIRADFVLSTLAAPA